MRCACVAAFFAVLLAAGARAEERIHIDVHGSSGRDYQVAVQRFQAEGAGAGLVEEFYRELTTAIEFSSVLKVVSPEAFLEPRTTQNYAGTAVSCQNWRGIGSDALVQGQLEVAGETVRVRFKTWDVLRCQEQGDRMRMDRSRPELSLLARTVADEIVRRFTGRRGVSSTQIAFVSDRSRNKEIYLIEANASGLRQITSNRAINLFPSWSPDGRTLVYTSYKNGRPDIWTIHRGSRPGGLLLANSQSKFRATWGPQNGTLALVMNADSNTDLFTVSSGGGRIKRLTTDRAIETSPSWSPDGRKLAFVSDRSGSPQVYIKDLASGDERRLTFAGSYNANPAWSPTGEWIAYAAQTGTDFDLYLIDPESGFTSPLVIHPRSDEDPAWSPDGRKLVFRSSRRGLNDLYRIDVDGRNLTRITQNLGNCSNPAWSGWPD